MNKKINLPLYPEDVLNILEALSTQESDFKGEREVHLNTPSHLTRDKEEIQRLNQEIAGCKETYARVFAHWERERKLKNIII